MQIIESIHRVFGQLEDVLVQLTPEQYTTPCKNLFQSSLGQHVRHIIELFQGLQNGYASGNINYEKRKRDVRIETEKTTAIQQLQHIAKQLNQPDKTLTLEANYNEQSAESILVSSNYYRELLYNLEHAVHHMALIRVGLQEVANVQLPDSFGVASSTVKHREACAQ